ncbi:hypothetical protein CDL12_22817 [Handroanthus impetiginosus]|uniref:Uncharacterized protein n=1 Tax=Handroanthus impetiginosus TaxID=429701 RepID=A0A2G9GH94_9LAMI|nr:hypothetical protein CDL12_22817 [Handroanthus impetiginosus]
MAPPKKPSKIKKDSKKLHKGKKKKKKNKTKINKTVPVDNTAVDSEWWDIFWKKNYPNPGKPTLSLCSLIILFYFCYS